MPLQVLESLHLAVFYRETLEVDVLDSLQLHSSKETYFTLVRN